MKFQAIFKGIDFADTAVSSPSTWLTQPREEPPSEEPLPAPPKEEPAPAPPREEPAPAQLREELQERRSPPPRQPAPAPLSGAGLTSVSR